MHIAINCKTVRLSETEYSSQVFGTLWIELAENEAYPEREWDDFVVVVLCWWIDGCLHLRNPGDKSQFCFMDGDYSFQLELINNTECNLRIGPEARICEKILLADFRENLRKVTNALINTLREKSIETTDTEKLVNLYPRLKRL